jgi:lipopolysaccharide export LptBFGC system permease protein LptF
MTPQLLTNQAFLEPKKMSLVGLNDQINFLHQQQLQATNYQLALWSRLLKPFSFFGLALGGACHRPWALCAAPAWDHV